MLNSIYGTTSSIELSSFLLCLLVSLILGFIISLTHKYTSEYSKNLLITISLLPAIVQAVILMVNGNLGTSIAIMGAFSLVRFRSIPGTSKEILIVFFSMAVGLAIGMGQLLFGTIITIVGCLIILLFTKITIFDKDKSEKQLKILIPENLDYTNVFDDIFNKYTKKVILEQSKTTNLGSMFELKYNVILKDKINEKEFIDELRTRNSNLKIILSRDNDNIIL